ncbi:MAG: hypothetical protein AAB482_01065 [Patescibacteria group bacterium]
MKKDSKKLVKKPFNIEHEIRGLGVMVEHVDHKLTLVGEVLASHTKLLEAHTKQLELHTEMIGGLVMDVEVIKSDIEFIKHGFKKKVDIEEFAALERRVILLEKRR